MLNTLNLSALSKPSIHSGFIARFAFAANTAFTQKQIVAAVRMPFGAMRYLAAKRGYYTGCSKLLISRCRSYSHAFMAFPRAITWSNEKIFTVVRMSIWAMSFLCIYGRKPNATQDVFAACDDFQMARIAANTISAQMVDVQPIGDGANKPFINFSMNTYDYMFPVLLNGSKAVSSLLELRMRPLPAFLKMPILQRDKAVQICHTPNYMRVNPNTSPIGVI